MSVMDGERPKRVNFKRQTDSRAPTMLSEAEIAAIREKARLAVQASLKDAEEDRLYQRFLDEERASSVPCEMTEPLVLDLAPTMPYIMLDGTQYLSGALYYVTAGVRAVLLEQMSRGWAHEELTQVRDDKGVRRRPPAHAGYGNFMDNRRARDMTVSAGALAGASPAQLLGIGT